MGQIVTTTDDVMARLGLDSPTASQTSLAESSINGAEGAIRKFLRYDPVQRTRTEYYPRQDFARNVSSGVWDIEGSQAVFIRDTVGLASELQLQHLPIRSITTLQINTEGRNGTGSFTSDHTKTEGTDFWANYDIEDGSGNKVCKDGILRSYGLWPTNPGSVKVVYVAGYTAAEFAGGGIIDAALIYEAVVDEAARRTKAAFIDAQTVGGTGSSGSGSFTAGFIQSERLGDYSYTNSNSLGFRGSSSDRLYGGIYSILPSTRDKLDGYVNYAIAE